MLTKLLKHEFRATARIMGPLYLVLLAVALGFNFSARLMDSGNFVLNMLAALVILAYVVAIIGVFVVAFILMLQRFYKNLLGDEGYIMFTLPASVHQHVWSKLIVSAVWFIATGVVVILSAFVAAFNVSFLTDLAGRVPQAVPAADRLLRRQRHRFRAGASGADAGSLHELLPAVLCRPGGGPQLCQPQDGPVRGVLLRVPVCDADGQRHRCWSCWTRARCSSLLAGAGFPASPAWPPSTSPCWLLIVLTAIYGAVFYIVTTITLKKRLNLE